MMIFQYLGDVIFAFCDHSDGDFLSVWMDRKGNPSMKPSGVSIIM
jgi:hypothetical protein